MNAKTPRRQEKKRQENSKHNFSPLAPSLGVLGVLAFINILFFAPLARAWNDNGHMVVALITYRQLDDAHRRQVDALLKQHPHYDLCLSQNREEGVNAEEWAFMRAATWPDWVRPARGGTPEPERFKGPEITKYHQGLWHFVTIPWVPTTQRSAMDPSTLPSRPEPNILTALAENEKILAKKDGSPHDRAVALAWLEHLVGDLHQPLHAGGMFSIDFPKGDKGGNDILVRSNGAVMKLHSVWDGALGNSDSYLAIAFVADQIMRDPILSEANLPELKKNTTFDSWAMESWHYAGAMAYLNGRLRYASAYAYEMREVNDENVPPLPETYMINANDLAKRRAAQAGARLAHLLTQALDAAK